MGFYSLKPTFHTAHHHEGSPESCRVCASVRAMLNTYRHQHTRHQHQFVGPDGEESAWIDARHLEGRQPHPMWLRAARGACQDEAGPLAEDEGDATP